MPSASLVKPTHKAIVAYYQTLQAYGEHDVEHETATRSAFQNLLAETAKAHHWLLVPEQPTRVGGKLVRPDGTLCDEYNLHRGYWEAKDTGDKTAKTLRSRSTALTSPSRTPPAPCRSSATSSTSSNGLTAHFDSMPPFSR